MYRALFTSLSSFIIKNPLWEKRKHFPVFVDFWWLHLFLQTQHLAMEHAWPFCLLTGSYLTKNKGVGGAWGGDRIAEQRLSSIALVRNALPQSFKKITRKKAFKRGQLPCKRAGIVVVYCIWQIWYIHVIQDEMLIFRKYLFYILKQVLLTIRSSHIW